MADHLFEYDVEHLEDLKKQCRCLRCKDRENHRDNLNTDFQLITNQNPPSNFGSFDGSDYESGDDELLMPPFVNDVAMLDQDDKVCPKFNMGAPDALNTDPTPSPDWISVKSDNFHANCLLTDEESLPSDDDPEKCINEANTQLEALSLIDKNYKCLDCATYKDDGRSLSTFGPMTSKEDNSLSLHNYFEQNVNKRPKQTYARFDSPDYTEVFPNVGHYHDEAQLLTDEARDRFSQSPLAVKEDYWDNELINESNEVLEELDKIVNMEKYADENITSGNSGYGNDAKASTSSSSPISDEGCKVSSKTFPSTYINDWKPFDNCTDDETDEYTEPNTCKSESSVQKMADQSKERRRRWKWFPIKLGRSKTARSALELGAMDNGMAKKKKKRSRFLRIVDVVRKRFRRSR